MLQGSGSTASVVCGKNTEEELARFKKHYTNVGRERSRILSLRSTITWNHSQGTQNRKLKIWQIGVQKDGDKIVIDWGNNIESWKEVKGFWDGSSKNNGRSCCGVIFKCVDRNKWIALSKIAVSLTIGTASPPKVVFVSLQASWISSYSNLSNKNINQCIRNHW